VARNARRRPPPVGADPRRNGGAALARPVGTGSGPDRSSIPRHDPSVGGAWVEPPVVVPPHPRGGMSVIDDGAPVNLRCSMLFFRNDSVLLCRRTDRDDMWVLPGGTPGIGEATATAARREVEEETGLQVAAERVAFVLETSSWDRDRHLIEIVFLGAERDRSAEPRQMEEHLEPVFVSLDDLPKVGLRPPIAGYVRGLARSQGSTAAYLGNVWRPDAEGPSRR